MDLGRLGRLKRMGRLGRWASRPFGLRGPRGALGSPGACGAHEIIGPRWAPEGAVPNAWGASSARARGQRAKSGICTAHGARGACGPPGVLGPIVPKEEFKASFPTLSALLFVI